MRILVCVKSVPELESTFRLNAAGSGYEESDLRFHVNEYDLCAVEEAVRIKERLTGVEITVVSVGPSRVETEIKKAMSLGADHGARIDLPELATASAVTVAMNLAAFARERNFDLILCGMMSEDLEQGATGPLLAEFLGWPCATTVISLSLNPDEKTLTCARELGAGGRELVELKLPAVIAVQSGINIPRWPSLTNVLRVKAYSLAVFPPSQEPPPIPSPLTRAYLPEPVQVCEFLEGDPEHIAEQLLLKIRSRVKVR